MKPRLTKEQAIAYLKRWDAVREVAIQELRSLSFRRKFSQIESLAQFGRYLHRTRKYKPLVREQEELQAVRACWAKLRSQARKSGLVRHA